MRTHHLLPLLLLLVPACGDDIKPADLSMATPQQLTTAIGAASGAQAFGSADRIMSMTKGSGCPSVEVRTDGSVVITGECGDYQGWVVIEPSLTAVHIDAEGFGDSAGTMTGTIDLALDRSRLDVELQSNADVSSITHLAISCAPGGLCQPDDGSWIELAVLGRIDVLGAWRPEPVGGFLTLIGLQTLTVDFNAAGECTPYTIDGLPAGCL
jgi:hypothetical protein